MTDKIIKEEYSGWMNEPAMTKQEKEFCAMAENDIEADIMLGFYAGFRAAERLAKIEVLKELLVDLESCGHGCIDILSGKLEKLEIN
mgnify:CR=1 FL=1